MDEVFNTMDGLSENIKEPMISKEVLRSLSFRFDAKVSTIEEMKDLDKLIMDELHGILITYENMSEKEKTSNKEATFKSSKKKKKYE